MELTSTDLFNLQILAERAVKEKIEKMKDLESKLCQLCRVCGDRASGRHYGVPSCDGCRGFFKRSVRHNVAYTCKYNMACIVDIKRRNQCQYCRFQRCLLVGMNKHAVQHERLPRKLSVHPQILKNNFPKAFFNQPLPNCMDYGLISPPPMLPMSPFYFDPLGSAIPNPVLMSPTMLPSLSRFSLFQHTQATTPTLSVHSLQPETRTETISPAKQNTPPAPKSPPSPVTPLSKKSAKYSIDSLLKATSGERIKQVPSALTPPNSPYQYELTDAKYNERVQQSLLRILEASIARVHTIPAYHNLPRDLKSNLLEDAWMQVFLLGIHEAGFPLESLTVYLQNVLKVTQGAMFDLQGLTKMEMGLRKLRELAIDSKELAYLRALALFDPYRQSSQPNFHLEGLHIEAQCMLTDYDRKCYPDRMVRPGTLLLLLTNLKQVPNTLAKLFFPKLNDMKNLVHHIHTTIVNESMRNVPLNTPI